MKRGRRIDESVAIRTVLSEFETISSGNDDSFRYSFSYDMAFQNSFNLFVKLAAYIRFYYLACQGLSRSKIFAYQGEVVTCCT